MSDSTIDEILQVNARLLECIDRADWNTYQEMCDPSLTAIEPESLGQVVEGLEFHRFYFFNRGAGKGNGNNTICSPRVRLMGDVAVLTYTRLAQRLAPEGHPVTYDSEETRIWQRRDGSWKLVHFHRSSSRQ